MKNIVSKKTAARVEFAMSHGRPMTASQVAEAVSISNSHTSKVLKAFLRQGMIVRRKRRGKKGFTYRIVPEGFRKPVIRVEGGGLGPFTVHGLEDGDNEVVVPSFTPGIDVQDVPDKLEEPTVDADLQRVQTIEVTLNGFAPFVVAGLGLMALAASFLLHLL